MIIDMSPRGLLYALSRHRSLLVTSIVMCFTTAAAYCLLATPIYRSEAAVVIKFANDNRNEVPGAAIAAASTEHREIINTNVRLLNSVDLLDNLLNEIGIANLYPKLAAAAAEDRAPLSDRARRELVHVFDNLLKELGIANLYPNLAAAAADARTPLSDLARRELVHDLSVTADRDSDVIELALENPDARIAATALSALIRLFKERQTQLYRNAQSWLMREQEAEARWRLSKSQADLDGFLSKFGISLLEDERYALLQLEMNTRSALGQQQAKFGEALGRQQAAAAALVKLTPEIALYDERSRYQAVDDPGSRIEQYRPAKVRRSPNPVYQETQTDLVRADEAADAARSAIKPLEQQLRQIEDRLRELASRQAEYHALTMQSEADEKSYRTFLQRADEARIMDALNSQNVSGAAVLQAPTVPAKPAVPKVGLILGLALLLGGLGGIAAGLIAEMLDETFSLPGQLEPVLSLPVLASFPMIRWLEHLEKEEE
jgi:uncharacterized protein involved in exopolysaccharide biosynthesis